MATLNLSTNGPSISRSYQSIINSSPSGPASKSPTYGQWAVFSVSAPLVNAFQQDTGGKESLLKVQSTGEGELVDLIDEFSDGRVQFAFVKVNDPNTTLPKYVLIAWCGEGVPERTKGYFTSHLAAVSKTLHGYHVQVTARSDRDLSPEGIVQKVSDASGSKYSAGTSNLGSNGPSPPISSKPAFTPTRSSGGAGGFNPLANSRLGSKTSNDTNVDEDGWGEDAPPVTRTQLEKVQSSYQPTKVNMRELSSQKPEISRFNGSSKDDVAESSNVIKGGYQPIGKVDIGALRRQAQETSDTKDDRPSIVKGSYEPVGKVDIAAIRARAQKPAEEPHRTPSNVSPSVTGFSGRSIDHANEESSHPSRSGPLNTSERLISLPKPKVGKRFESSASNFSGTVAPKPRGFDSGSLNSSAAPPVGVGRTFADQGGKTPAQLWAEKKARERGLSGGDGSQPLSSSGGPTPPLVSQVSGSGEWKSGYGGKSWAPVQTTRTGQSSGGLGQQLTGEDSQEAAPASPAGGISSIRERFKDVPPIGIGNIDNNRVAPSPPPLDTTNKPNAGRGIANPSLPSRPTQGTIEKEVEQQEVSRLPTPPPQPPRSLTPPTPPAPDTGSPIRVARPVGRGDTHEITNAREEQFSPPPAMPIRSLAHATPDEDDLTEEPSGHDPARAAGQAAAAASFGTEPVAHPQPGIDASGQRALVQYDYDKNEDNEVELKEGDYVTNIEMVDEDWWMGQNKYGESGLFPSNYVELVEEEVHLHGTVTHEPGPETEKRSDARSGGSVATALYDYDAAEDNELSFPENARITDVEFPDSDWWSGEYGGKSGLFPASYVRLDD